MDKNHTQPEEEKERHTIEDLMDAGITNDPGEMGPTGGVGLPEAVSAEELDREDISERESLLRVPSDMRSVGSRDAGDDGIPGGMAEGGAESLGGSGGMEKSAPEDYDQKMNEGDLAGMGGTGAANEGPDDDGWDIGPTPPKKGEDSVIGGPPDLQNKE